MGASVVPFLSASRLRKEYGNKGPVPALEKGKVFFISVNFEMNVQFTTQPLEDIKTGVIFPLIFHFTLHLIRLMELSTYSVNSSTFSTNLRHLPN
jgi:hypothetical protein